MKLKKVDVFVDGATKGKTICVEWCSKGRVYRLGLVKLAIREWWEWQKYFWYEKKMKRFLWVTLQWRFRWQI